jgi:hypothetical protein
LILAHDHTIHFFRRGSGIFPVGACESPYQAAGSTGYEPMLRGVPGSGMLKS